MEPLQPNHRLHDRLAAARLRPEKNRILREGRKAEEPKVALLPVRVRGLLRAVLMFFRLLDELSVVVRVHRAGGLLFQRVQRDSQRAAP